MTLRVGFFGGCFNPVHHGHIAVARAAQAHLQLDQLIFIPSGQPPLQDKQNIVAGTHRLAMLNLALADMKNMHASAVEILRTGPSYTIDTIHQLRAELPADSSLFFILGSDCLDRLARWKSIAELHNMLRFAIAQRPDMQHPLTDSRLIPIPMEAPPISSSQIRAQISTGGSIAELVPPPVAAYIHAHNLYGPMQDAAA